MRATQLVLDFGRSVRTFLSDRKQAPLPPPPKNDLRDHRLEELSRRLLREAGCPRLKFQVQWNPRLRSTAGIACWRTRTISLNPRLEAIGPAEVERTLRHELAHFLAQHRAGRRRIAAHGPEWRQACRDLGIPKEPRCHNLALPRSERTKKHFYVCPHCGNPLARVRPIRRPLACLDCCRRHNQGRYDDRFRFRPVTNPNSVSA